MKVRVLETSFINDRLVHAGDIVDYDGELGDNLEVIDEKPAKEKKAD